MFTVSSVTDGGVERPVTSFDTRDAACSHAESLYMDDPWGCYGVTDDADPDNWIALFVD
jgi:hypothetical protein